MPNEYNFKVVNNITPYTIAGYEEGTATEIRQTITSLLRERRVAVNGSVIKRTRIEEMLESINPATGLAVKIPFVYQGAVLVKGNGDTEEGSYPIQAHKNVCFDMTHGNGVTGINPNWHPKEYYPVGIALKSLSSGQAIVPIALVTPRAEEASLIPFRLTATLNPLSSTPDNAVMLIWSTEEGSYIDGEVITVIDALYNGLSGVNGDRGVARVMPDGTNHIYTLTCSA